MQIERIEITKLKAAEYNPRKDLKPSDPEFEKLSELKGNIYNHCIQYKLSKEQRLVDPFSFRYGDGVKIIYDGREYGSIFTGMKFTKGDPFVTCLFGKTRITKLQKRPTESSVGLFCFSGENDAAVQGLLAFP